MKKIVYMLLLGSIMCACGDEEGMLEPQMQLENLYTIVDDPDDAVKHHVYEIYEKYGVPVYFNDTIGKFFVKTDVTGNPYYRDEVLDLAWNFDSYDQSSTYEYDYCTDPAKQEEMLKAIELYLEDAAKPLWPFAFFVVDSARTVNKKTLVKTKWEDKYNLNNFRTIVLINGNWDWEEDEPAEVMTEMKRSYVINKISNFPVEVAEFGSVSHDYYDKYFGNTDLASGEVLTIGNREEVDAEGSGLSHYDYIVSAIGSFDEIEQHFGSHNTDFFTRAYLRPDYFIYDTYSPEDKALLAKLGRDILGGHGVVAVNEYSGYVAYEEMPADEGKDMQYFVRAILSSSDADFRAEWGDYPRVMQKYEILYRLLTEKLGLEL